MKPLNNGHIGGRDIVLCREVVLFQRLKNTMTISLVPRNVSIVERLSFFSEGPLSEVPLYSMPRKGLSHERNPQLSQDNQIQYD